ncbi:multicopper oxidase domain-containing protein [soil metagenome]
MSRKRWYLLMNSVVALWLVAVAVVVGVHRFVPQGGWLMVHLLLLGAVSTAILIWSQHFADSLLRRTEPGGRVIHAVRLLGHTVGAGLVIAGALTGLWPLVLSGGTLVAAVAIGHVVILLTQSRGALPARFAPLVRYYIAAALFLVVGVSIGVVMARSSLTPDIHDRLYPAHLAANLLGWVGLTVMGTATLLWPTVLHARVSDSVDVISRWALRISVSGLIVVGAASLLDLRPLFAFGILIYLVGVGVVGVDGARLVRRATQQTFASWSIAAAYGWFVFCTVAFGIVLLLAPSWTDAAASLGWIIGPVVTGFVAQVLLGALSYLLPVVIGGGPAMARRTANELDRAGLYRVAVVNLGIVVYLLPVPSFVRVAVSLLVFAVLAVFLVLAARAVMRSRAGASADHEKSVAAPSRRVGAVSAAVATVVIAMTIGIAADPVAAGLQVGQPVASVAPTGHVTTVEVSMDNMRFVPDVVQVPVGDELIIRLANADDQVHDLVLANGVTSGLLNPQQTVDVAVGVVGSDLDGWCSIAGHRLLGMVMTVTATGAATSTLAPSTAAPEPPGGHSHGTDPTEPSAAGNVDLMKKPAESFEARDAALPPATSNSAHRVTFTVSEGVQEVAPGIMQTRWTFNGTAPGPILRGKVGDTFVITLINGGSMGHSIDFHAGSLAPNLPMRTIQPGERLTYTFTATRSGIWMYHCSTMPMSMHISNGMFGAVIIDPVGLPPVDREFVLVQSELYLGPQGESADVLRIATQNPELVVFNGYANQYAYRPIEVHAGERVRVWVLDVGPNRSSVFHVVGGQFDTVFSEGDYVLKNGGSSGSGGSQALALQPAQGGFVELVFPEPGDYSFLSHIMSDAEKGAFGIFHVTSP